MSFGNFKGRKRETERIITLLKADQFCTDDQIAFLKAQYITLVPFHNQVHIGYGLLFLIKREIPVTKFLLERQLFQLWLGHDAGHNGNSAESPEEKSLEICRQAFPCLNYHDAILNTKFPYAYSDKKIPYGTTLRNLDTLRPASGILADPKINGSVSGATLFHAFLFECGLLFLELNKPPLEWLEKGQLGFFFPQIRCSLIANMFDEEFSNFKQMMIGSWENEVKLGQLMSGEEGRAKLINAIDFLMNDVTLPEFVEFANGIDLK